MTGASRWSDAIALADEVRRGALSPIELVDEAITRIEARPELGAMVHERFERARAEASGDLPDGPFRGVPTLVKDLGAAMAGEPYHAGTTVLRRLGYTPTEDAHLVERLRRAGFVILGRTNTPELGSTITTEPVASGPTRNPWDIGRSAGGSSGGSAAAVAAGFVSVAHASDGGGSIRIPASSCALVGLKPSRGRISKGPTLGETWMGATTDGAVTRSVRDTAAMLDVLAGYEVGDPVVAPPPARPWLDEVRVDPGRLRIGVLDHPLLHDAAADPDCSTAVAGAAELLASLGHSVEAAWPEAMGDPLYPHRFLTIVAAATAHQAQQFAALKGSPLAGDDLERMNHALAAVGERTSVMEYLDTVEWLHAWSRRVLAWWHGGGFDLLVCPVVNGPPPPLGWLMDPDHGTDRLLAMMQYTSQFNVTGQPAVSVPLHWTADGLPVGVQLVAAYGREDLLVRVAASLEAARPWADRHPPDP